MGLLIATLLAAVDVAASATRAAATAAGRRFTIDPTPILKWSGIAAGVGLPVWFAVTRRLSPAAKVAVVAWLLAFPAVLLAVALLGTSSPPRLQPGRGPATPAVTAAPAPGATPSSAAVPDLGGSTSGGSVAARYGLLTAALLALAGAAAAAALLRRQPRFTEQADGEPPLPAMPVADPVAPPSTPREAVIRDYTIMQEALAARGHRRHPWQTSAEYAVTAAAAVQTARDAPVQLTSLFELARYSPHPIDPSIQAKADHNLAAVLDDLQSAHPADPGAER